MALTDIEVVADMALIAAGDRLVIQPTGSEEWVIHNLKYAAAVNIYQVSAVGEILFDQDDTAGARLGYAHHVTSSYWLEIENASGGAALLAYDGVKTHD